MGLRYVLYMRGLYLGAYDEVPVCLISLARIDKGVALFVWGKYIHTFAVSVAKKYCSDTKDVEDAVERACDKFCSKIHQLKKPGSVYAWSGNIVRNVCYDVNKAHHKDSFRVAVYQEDIKAEQNYNESPLDALIEREEEKSRVEFYKVVRKLMEELQPKEKEVLEQYYDKKRTLKEISESRKIPYRTTTYRFQTGLRQLGTMLRRELKNNEDFHRLVYSAFGDRGVTTIKKI